MLTDSIRAEERERWCASRSVPHTGRSQDLNINLHKVYKRKGARKRLSERSWTIQREQLSQITVKSPQPEVPTGERTVSCMPHRRRSTKCCKENARTELQSIRFCISKLLEGEIKPLRSLKTKGFKLQYMICLPIAKIKADSFEERERIIKEW